MSEWHSSIVAGSCLLTAVFVNAGSSSLRASWWNGGSEVIGGEPPAGARSRGGRKLVTRIAREEKARCRGDFLDVLITCRQPGAAKPLGVRDRAALPQVVLDRVRISGPFGIKVGEVSRPVGDRAGDDLAAGAGGLPLRLFQEPWAKRPSAAISTPPRRV